MNQPVGFKTDTVLQYDIKLRNGHCPIKQAKRVCIISVRLFYEGNVNVPYMIRRKKNDVNVFCSRSSTDQISGAQPFLPFSFEYLWPFMVTAKEHAS